MSGVEGSEDMEKLHYPAEGANGTQARVSREPDRSAGHPDAEPKRHQDQAGQLGKPW